MMFDMAELKGALKEKGHGLDVTDMTDKESPNAAQAKAGTAVGGLNRTHSDLRRSGNLRSSMEGNERGDRLRFESDREDALEAVSSHPTPS